MSIKTSIKKTSLFKLFTAFIITLVCTLGLSACTWFTGNDTPAGDSAYDADGNLRVTATSVSLIRPSANGSVNENTGSFVWDLSYYLDGANVAPGLDQLFYNTEFFDNPTFDAGDRADAQFLFAGKTYTTYNSLTYSVSESGYYKVIIGETTVSYDRVKSLISADQYNKIKFLTAGTYSGTTQYTISTNGYYLVEDVDGITYAARVYTKYTDGSLNLSNEYGQNLTTSSYSGYYFRYPSYTVSVSGISYQIKVDVNYNNLIFDFNSAQMFKLDTSKGATAENTFNFSYRIGSIGDWISCKQEPGNNPSNYKIASAFEQYGKFYVRFNPMLGKGSTSRYIRVQSNVSHQFSAIARGNSVYTSPINFNVYKLTFGISCNNSVEATYESILYNANKYYFAQTEVSANKGLLNNDYFTSITGYFVEGRIVEVERYMDKNGDYAFQSWTVNGKADNTVVLKKALPNNNGGYINYKDEDNNLSCLNLNSINNRGITEVKLVDAEDLDSTLGTTTNKAFAEVFDTTTNKDVITGTVYAVACNNTASNVLYANVAKVKNFILSGTVYDGDNFFSVGGNAVLGDVDLYIWKDDVPFARYIARVGSVEFEVLNETVYEDYLTAMALDTETGLKNSCTYQNSQFIINNLAWDCYITFGKTLKKDGDETPYRFYSAAMSQRDGFYALDPNKAEYIISDRVGNAIIGTALNAESKVEVNIYVTDDAGHNLTPIDETKTSVNGVQYQIISTTNTQTDVFGYTTSSVIISLLLPSNCSLTAYNLESINSIASAVYKTDGNDANYILCDIGYDESNRLTQYTYYYVQTQDIEDTESVSDGQTLNCLLYDGNYYQYTHRDQESTGVYNYYYEYAETVDETISYTNANGNVVTEPYSRLYRHIIKRTTNGTTVNYTLLDYKALHNSEYSTKNNTSQEGANKITVSYSFEYEGNEYSFASQSEGSDINIIATAYLTDLQYIYTDKNGDEQTNSMYVYYSTKEYKYNNSGENVTEYYYTAPIGKRSTKILNSDLAKAQTTVSWFHSELESNSNLNDLLYSIDGTNVNKDGCIMLGADILEIFSGARDTETIDTRFYQALGEGKSIIADNFYYIKPLGESAELLISQYFSTDAETIVTEATVFSEYKLGNLDFTYKEDANGLYVYIDDKYTLDASFTYSGEQRYKLVYASPYVYVDANGDGKKEYVYDIDGSLYPAETTRYTREIYQGQVYSEPLGYTYRIGGLLQSPNDSYHEVYIDYVKGSGTVYEYKLNGQKVVTSMNTGIMDDGKPRAYLYNIGVNASYSYNLYAPDDDTNGQKTLANSFINQEANNQIIKNAELIGTYTDDDDNTYFYLKERYYYDVLTRNNLGEESTKSFTTEYKFYTYTSKNNGIYETSIYYDGSNFYIALNSTIVINNAEYPLLAQLVENENGTVYYYDGKSTYIEFLTNNGGKYSVVNEFTVNTTDGRVNYINVCMYKYYEIPQTVSSSNPTAFGTSYQTAIGYVQEKTPGSFEFEFINQYYLNNAEVINLGIDNNYYTSDTKETQIYAETVAVEREGSSNKVVRRALLASNTAVDVHLLGKIVLLGDGEVNIYPSFNYNLPNTSVDILNISDEGLNYFSIDYTTVTSVIQAFPGVKILSGAPYVNPIMYFEVKHKADERAVVEIGLEISNAYYVEVITNALTSTTKNIIYDFSTVSFKDTITNLTQNDYINRMYYVLDKDTQNSIIAYTQNADGSYSAYLGGTPLTIQNIGLNDDDVNVYSIMQLDENNKYTQPLYYKLEDESFELLNTEELIIWESSSTTIQDLPTFDVHNYYVADNGLVILTSDGKENEKCALIEDLYISGSGSTTSYYDYNEVMIGGFTSAYRVNNKDLANISSSDGLQSYWWEDAINISNSYNSTDPYFLTGKEGVVLVASPIVQLYDSEEYENIIYRFKRWAIYSRYNSEILYYNQTLSNGHVDRSNAVMRFSSSEAGYFVFMPIYERVYTINVGTSIYDGPQNLGGSVSVIYDGASIDMENAKIGEDALNIYFVEMLKTSSNGTTQYQYSDLEIQPILYFTGKFQKITNKNGSEISYPIFEVKYDIIKIVYTTGSTSKTLYYTYENGKIVNLPVITTMFNQRGIVEVKANNGQYNFKYVSVSVTGSSVVTDMFARTGQKLDGYDVPIDDLLSYTYSVNYYLDGVSSGNSTAKNKVVFYYTSEGFARGDNYMYAIDIKDILDLYQQAYSNEQDFIDKLINAGERFATAITKQFNSLATASDVYVELDYQTLPNDFAKSNDAFYFSNLAYLASGALYSYYNEETDEEEVYTTQQFKTSYFERDSKLIISADADLGYRLKDWYLAEYDDRTKSWVVSDTALTDTINAVYTDIIRNVYYNPDMGTNGSWYYVTDYYEQVGEYRVYYYDEEKTQQSTVAASMLDSVRGYYARTKDTYGNDVWIPVYRTDYNSGDWYTDATFTTKYTGDISAIEIRSHYDCIRTWNDGDSTRYLIGNVEVWENNGNYYRTKDIGNMFFKDNKIYIYNLHNNIRVVAEFIEVYQSFVFAENSTDDNIEVVSLYYSGIRSNLQGETMEDIDKICTGMDEYDFYDKKGEQNTQHINDTNYIGLANYTQLREATPLLKAREEKAGELVDARVNLVNMRFDVYTTIYIVVKVYYNKSLNIHTLGMNTSYQLTPVLYPTEEYINLNLAADENERDDHYFYIFKVTFDRDLNYYYSTINENITSAVEGSNYNPEYVIHVNRANTLVADVISGNYSKYYSDLFKFYDADGIEVVLDFNESGEVRLGSSYRTILSDKLNSYGIDTSTSSYEEMINMYRPNIKSLFQELSKEYGYVMSFSKVSDKTGVYNADDKFCSVEKIYNVLRNKFVVTDNRITGPQRSGATNFINLSSIPVYTYTTSIKVLSSINESNVAGTNFDDEMVQVLLENGIKLDQTIYTRGGYQGYTYIGLGEEHTVSSSISVNNSSIIYPHKFTGNTEGNIADADYADLFEQDYALAKDTIMVLGGLAETDNLKKSDGGVWYVEITTSDNGTPDDTTDDTTVKYIFSGWFEQKVVTDKSGKEVWGDLQLMSNDIHYPFASVAYADTNIIALFERAIDLEISAATNSATINFNTLCDSLNNPIQKVIDDTYGTFTLKGTFTISSKIDMDVTPSGGFRFGDTWNISINSLGFTDSNTTSLYGNSYLSYKQEGLEYLDTPSFVDLNLVKTINVAFTLGQMLASFEASAQADADASGVSGEILNRISRSNNKLDISLNMVQVQLTYITVEGYTRTIDGINETLSGYEFNIYYKNGEEYNLILSTYYANGSVTNIANTSIKDSAQRPINIQLVNGTLSIYGYFDFEKYTDNLLIEYVKQNQDDAGSIKAWYINTHGEPSNDIDPWAIKDVKSFDERQATAFKISYVYTYNETDGTTNLDLYNPEDGSDVETTQDLVDFYNHNLFNLSENNFAYLLSAKIQAKSNLNVSYATIESIKDVDGEIDFAEDGNATLISKEELGSISWTGALFTKDEGTEITLVNGTEKFVDTYDENKKLTPTSYSFYSDTKVTLLNNLEFYIDDNNTFYKFIGWFTYSDNILTFISDSATYNTNGSGNYVAIFARLAIIDDVYTTTLNTDDGNINQNGTISITSNYSLNQSVVTLEEGAVNTINTVTINVFGTCSNLENNGKTIPSFMYAVVGSSIKIKVVADTRYLVNDIVFTCNGLTNETSILVGNNGYISGEAILSDIGENDENNYVIIAKLSRGYDVRVIQIYYDTITMNNTGIIYTDQNLVNIERADVEPNGNNGIGVYSFCANTVINITFNEARNFGLIGYYVNDVKINFATTDEGTFVDLDKLLAIYTVNDDITIEVRITKYVSVRTSAVDENHNSLTNITTEFSYIDHYTNETIVHSVTSAVEWKRVLSGTVLSFNTYTEQSSAFVKWEKTEQFNGNVVGTSNELISSLSKFELTVEYNSGNNYTTDIDYTFLFSAIYQPSCTVTVEKIITSYNTIDQIYRTVNPDTSITWAPEFWANLDVSVTYTNINGEEQTIFLGSKNKLDQPLNVKSGTSLIVTTNISKAVENRYSAIIKINNVDITSGVAQLVRVNQTVKIEFYAKRNITLVRQVNNQEYSYASTDNKNLNVSFALGDTGAVINNSLSTTASRNTWEDIASGQNVTITATQDSNYTFAGFYINGIAVGKGIHNPTGGYYNFFIKQGDKGLVNDSDPSSTAYDTLYTYDTDLTIIALWYNTTNIIASVNLDGVNILTDDSQSNPTFKELSNNLVFRLIGNKVTYNANNNYNTALQTIIATNENYNNLVYLCNNNLALVASQFAGYQFVGFYYREAGSSNFIKLDFSNSNNFGDTLTSIIAAENLVAGKTYYIEARYLTAWQVSQLISITNQSDTSKLEDNGLASAQFIQLVNPEIGTWTDITTLPEYNTFAGTNTNNYFIKYFYPYYSNYIGVYFDSGIESLGNGVTSIGYYINGVYVDVITTVEINDKEYAIIDVLQYINTVLDTELESITKNENDIYDFTNLVIERKYVKNVEYIVRIGVDNTSDITKLNQIAFNDLSVTIHYYGDYITETTIIYSNEGTDTYWNDSNNSLYIKLILPIGTTISTSVNAETLKSALKETVENGNYLYNGWFMYSNYSIAGSTSVINYTNTVDFVLTNDTDIVAQYFVTKISKTTDTQYSYKFNGQDFTNRLYSPAIQGSVTNYSIIASAITQILSTIEYNSTDININVSAASGEEGTEYITITSTDGIIFNITHQIGFTTPTTYRFMFMGWYQEIKDSRNPSTFLFVTNNLGLDYTGSEMPAQMQNATNMIAIFTQIVELKLKYADGETVNSINYTNLKQNYTQVAPIYFTDVTKIGDYLNTSLLEDGTLVWNTLYESNLFFNYYAAYGYHYNANLESECSIPWNKFETSTGNSVDPGIKQNVDAVAIQYLQKDNNASIANTKYNYKVSSLNNKILNVTATPKCGKEDHCVAPAAALTTSVINAGGSKASLATVNTFASAVARATSITDADDGIIIEENTNDIKSFISGQVISPNNSATGINFVITIRFPDSTTKQLILNGENLFDMLYEEDEQGNPTSVIRSLPLGTTIYIQTLSVDNRSEILNDIKVYYFDNEADFINKDLDLLSITNVSELNLSETNTIVVTEDLNLKYLRVVVTYTNIFGIELENNDIKQGNVAIQYKNGDVTDTACNYDVTIQSQDYFAFNNMLISFTAGEIAPGEPNTVETSLLELLYSFNENATNLTDIIRSIEINRRVPVGNWEIELNYNSQDSIYTSILTYTYNDIVYVKIEMEFSFGEPDYMEYSYITGITSTFTINTNVKISIEYLHVTTVRTNYTIERFDANTAGYTSSEKSEEVFNLYVFDYEFFTYPIYEKYIAIQKLDKLFAKQIARMSDLEFIGYSYAGGILSSEPVATQHLVITQEEYDAGKLVSNIINIEAVFVEQLTTNVGIEVDYYNDEMDETLTDNPNLLNTPLDNIQVFVNKVASEEQFTDITSTISINSNLNQSTDITVLDNLDYFSFIKWVVKYDGKYIAKTGSSSTYIQYTIDYAALNVDANLYITLIEQYKQSATYNFSTTQEEMYAKYTGDSIDLSKFVICAYLQEEVVELSFDYQYAGETFDIKFTENENSIADISSQLDSVIIVGGNSGDYAVGYKHTFLINQIEIPAEDVTDTNDYRLIIVYSKGLIEQNAVNITVIASQYKNRDDAYIAKAIGTVPVRHIAPEVETKQYYGQSKFLKINGFKNSLGEILVDKVNDVENALSLTTTTSTHSTTYTIDTTNLYLIELGMALDKELLIADTDYNRLTINNTTIEAKYSLSADGSYGAVSLLVAEGEVVNISIKNFGELEYQTTATGSNYRGMAISNNYTISDLYKVFYDSNYSVINTVNERAWRNALGMSSDSTDFANDYYTTLYQYSGFNIPLNATEYTFIANQNTSIVADYIGFFKEQKRYISVLLNADGSIKYVNNNASQQSYIGENFVITLAYNKTPIVLDKVLNEDIKYSLDTSSTIVKTSIQGIADEDINLRYDFTLNEENEVVPNIKFVSQACQLAIGLVTEKYISSDITIVFKYVAYNKTIIDALSKALERAETGEEPVNPEEPEDNILYYGYYKPETLDSNPKVYMLNLELTTSKDVTTYLEKNKDDPDNYPLTTQVDLTKGSKVALLAEKRSGYTFAGFKISSQAWDLNVNNFTQGINSSNIIYISKASTPHITIKVLDKEYYYVDYLIDGNASVMAVYEPNVYLVNITNLTYDEQTVDIANGGSFNPDPSKDQTTTQGKVLAQSLVISSGDILELTVVTNGFAEYKGIATDKTNPSVKAIYSNKATINNPDASTINSKNIENTSFKDALEKFNDSNENKNNEYTNEFTYLHYNAKGESTDISDGVTRGYITGSKLFTDDYSTNNYGVFEQNIASVSYLYLIFDENISGDTNLYAYFNAIYYNMNIEFNELEYGYTDEQQYTNPDDIDDKILGNSPYISFNKQVIESEGWINPSANSAFGIADKDPYVYTWYDNNGTLLAYPVKLTLQMINGIEPSEEYNYLTLRQFTSDYNSIKNVYSKPNTDNTNRISLTTTITNADGKEVTVKTLSQTYKSNQIDNIYDYIEIQTDAEGKRTYKLADNLFEISINGETIDSGELLPSDGNIRTMFTSTNNFVEINNIIVNSLATISVKINFAPNSNEPSIKITAKIFADKNSGFPAVAIKRPSNKNGSHKSAEICEGSIMLSSLYLLENQYEDHIPTLNETNVGIEGFFFSDAFIADEENGYLLLDTEKYPDLNLYGVIAYARASKYSEAKLSVSNLNGDSRNTYDVMITNPNLGTDKNVYISKVANATNDNNQVSLLNWINYKYHTYTNTSVNGYCTSCKMFHNCNNGFNADNMPNCGIIDNYFMYTITNAQMYVDAIETAANNHIIDNAKAIEFISELLSFNPAAGLTTEEARNKDNYDSLPKYGSIFNYIEFSKASLSSILWASGYIELYYRLNDPNCKDLYFTQLDVYSNFKNTVNKNFFGNSLSYGDLLVSACKLSEHTAPHKVNYDIFGGIWEETEPGYKYVNYSTADYGFSSVNDAYYSYFDNNYGNEIANAAAVPIANAKAVANWLAGITNGKAKYAGTFNYLIHSGLIPNTKEFADKSSTTFINTVKIDLSDSVVSLADDDTHCMNGRIKTERLDKVHGNLLIAIGEIVVGAGLIAAAIVAGIYSAGAGTVAVLSLAGALVTTVGIYDTVMVVSGNTAADLTPFHNYINNLDFSFD